MPIEEFDGLNNKIAKLEGDIHKHTVEGKIKIERFAPIVVFRKYQSSKPFYFHDIANQRADSIMGAHINSLFDIDEGMREIEIEEIRNKEFKKAVKDIYEYKEELKVQSIQAHQKLKEHEEKYSMNFMQRLVYLFRGKL